MASSTSEDYLDKLLAGVTESNPADGEAALDALLDKAEGTETVVNEPEVVSMPVSEASEKKEEEDTVSTAPALNEAEEVKEEVVEEPVEEKKEEKKSVADAIRESLSEKQEVPEVAEEEPVKEPEEEKKEEPVIQDVTDEEAKEEADDLFALLTKDKDELELETDDDEDTPDIEALLAQAEKSGTESAKKDIEAIENADIQSLAGAAEGDKELSDITAMLEKSDENVLLDASIGEVPDDADKAVSEETEAPEEGKKKKKKLFGRKKKEKDSETQEEGEEKPKKKKRLFGKKKKEEESASAGEAEGEVSTEEASDAVAAAGEASNEATTEATTEESASAEKAEGEATTEESAGTEEVEEEAGDKKKKKPGFFQKLLNLLTEEVDEGEEGGEASAEEGLHSLSDENKAVLEAVESEDEEDGKGKKGKKEKKEKKPKEKKEKKAKPKKEKIKKNPDPSTIGPKLPKKYVAGNLFLAISIIVAILLVNSYLPNMTLLKEGREAFYKGDYKSAFLSMYGKDLNEGDQILYEKARTIVILDRKLESHRNYEAMNMPYEALNALFDGLAKYDKLLVKAESLGIEKELKDKRDAIIAELSSQYGITDMEAKEILTYSPINYTRKLNSIIAGTTYISIEDAVRMQYGEVGVEEGAIEDETVDPSTLEDLLPEEEEYFNREEDVSTEETVVELETEETGTEETETGEKTTGASAQVGDTPIEIQIESENF